MVRTIFAFIVLMGLNCNLLAEYKFSDSDDIRFAQEKHDVSTGSKMKLVWSGMADFRYALTDKERSFQEAGTNGFGGSGLFRYGGKDRDGNGTGDLKGNGFHLSSLDLLVDVTLNKNPLAHIHLRHDESSFISSDENKIGLFEAYLNHDLFRGKKDKLNLRFGILLPSLSLENQNQSWATGHTITPSAINTWFGEEMRLRALQLRYSRILGRSIVDIYGGLYNGNDGLGSILSWRGWTLHDSYSYYAKSLRLREQTLVTAGSVNPFVETDNKMGFYTRLGVHWNKLIQLNYSYLDNNGDVTLRDPLTRNWAWDTKFHHLAAAFGPYAGFKLWVQAIKGSTKTGRAPEVNNDFESAFVMLIKEWEKWDTAVRLENFRVLDRDIKTDRNSQNGQALTFGLNYRLDIHQKIMLEAVSASHERLGNESFSSNRKRQHALYQLGYRLNF